MPFRRRVETLLQACEPPMASSFLAIKSLMVGSALGSTGAFAGVASGAAAAEDAAISCAFALPTNARPKPREETSNQLMFRMADLVLQVWERVGGRGFSCAAACLRGYCSGVQVEESGYGMPCPYKGATGPG